MLAVGCGRPPHQHPGQGCCPDASQSRNRPPRSRPHSRVFTAHGPCQPPCSALSQGTRCPGPKSKAKRRPGPALKTLRALAEGPGLGASAPAPRDRPADFSLASLSQTSRRVGRAARSQKHRISRAWERSFRFRSLGRAPASAVIGSVSAGALPSPFAAWGRLITPLRPLGACATFRSKTRKLLPENSRVLFKSRIH